MSQHIDRDIRSGLHGGLSMSEYFRPAPGSKAFQEVRRKPGTMFGVKQPQLKEPLELRTEREAERGSHYLTERPT